MNAQALLPTAALLGAFILFGGAYGLMYTVGGLRHRRAFVTIAFGLFAAQGLVLLAVLAASPLAVGWKLLLLAAYAAFGFIPPRTLRYLESTHGRHAS